jgi:hypothetical protein
MYVRSTLRLATHLQFNISANALEIRAVQSPKRIVWCAVDYVSEMDTSIVTGANN